MPSRTGRALGTDYAVDGSAYNGAVTLATRDYGGEGPDLLFVPGAGQTLVDCDLLAPFLTSHHRLVAMDLRGHGESSDGVFTWTAALEDIEAVCTALGLHRPAVVGHSLGGILAAMHGARHPDALGVINLDGHAALRPEQYVGVAPELVSARMAELKSLREVQIGAMRANPPLLSAEGLAAMAADYQARYGLDAGFVDRALARSHVRTDGGFTARAGLDLTMDILTSVEQLDAAALYRACRAPLLVYNAMRPEAAGPDSPPGMADHVAAYRRGLSQQLRAVETECPNLTFLEVDATHALIYEQPELISAQIATFLAAQSSSDPSGATV